MTRINLVKVTELTELCGLCGQRPPAVPAPRRQDPLHRERMGAGMTTTTDLLRRAAELLRGYVNTYEQVSEDEPGGYCSDEDAEMDGVAASLLALADQMERAVPVG